MCDGDQPTFEKSATPNLKRVQTETKKKQQTLDLFVNTSTDSSKAQESNTISFKVNQPSKKHKK